jgi:hypothetical protein
VALSRGGARGRAERHPRVVAGSFCGVHATRPFTPAQKPFKACPRVGEDPHGFSPWVCKSSFGVIMRANQGVITWGEEVGGVSSVQNKMVSTVGGGVVDVE